MSVELRPMLAAALSVDRLHTISYPKIVQIKYDGIRAICRDGVMISRSGKLIPNASVQKFFQELYKVYPKISRVDGELLIGDPTDPKTWGATSSGIMTKTGTPNFVFYAFDRVMPQLSYSTRRSALMNVIDGIPNEFRSRIQLVGEYEVNAPSQVRMYLNQFLGDNLEGCILRDPEGLYKNGRSTLNQQLLLKVKDIQEAEAIVVGTEPLMINLNDSKLDELGYTTRSSHKEGKIAQDMLGALVVRAPAWGNRTFKIGTGFTHEQRYAYWKIRPTMVNAIVKFKYLSAGMKDLPRHPVFMGFRHEKDIDASHLVRLKALGVPE